MGEESSKVGFYDLLVMLQYLIILLDDTSVSYCHHKNKKVERKPMPLEILEEGIRFGMKENLNIQFVLPDYPLPLTYWQEVLSIDHTIIAPGCVDFHQLAPRNVFYKLPDVVVFEDIDTYIGYSDKKSQSCVLKIDKRVFFENVSAISDSFKFSSRLNVVITDIDTFMEADFVRYKQVLDELSEGIIDAYLHGKPIQFNLLTDRMMLNKMNNCDAGVSNITLAPDGNFYICPAFYQDDGGTPIRESFNIGSLKEGLVIKNHNLYKIEYAQLCRNCDAFHCKRCIWLNNKTTYEINTPSHEQCVAAHIERNASRRILYKLREHNPSFLQSVDIKEIEYLDPFDVKKEL